MTACNPPYPRDPRVSQPLEVLRVGMKREFMVVEDEDEYDQVILSLAATEVGGHTRGGWCSGCAQGAGSLLNQG